MGLSMPFLTPGTSRITDMLLYTWKEIYKATFAFHDVHHYIRYNMPVVVKLAPKSQGVNLGVGAAFHAASNINTSKSNPIYVHFGYIP